MCACGRGAPGWKLDPGVCPNDDDHGPANGHCACCHEPDGDGDRRLPVPVTAVDVDALDKMREAATAGPWSTDGDGVVMARFIAGDLPPLREPIAEAHRPDAALIVAAVNALPDLLAAVRERDALRVAVEEVASHLAHIAVNRLDPLHEIADRLRAVLAAVAGEQR